MMRQYPCAKGEVMARLLVVDDSESVFLFVRRALEEDGHLVERLEAFTELSSYLRKVQPDLILLDLEMPALSGTAFALFLRRIERRPIKIVIHSSLPEVQLRKAAQEVKAVGILPKTQNVARLRETVGRFLREPTALGTST
jgi:CheY-like chemotaxis protein